MPPRPTPVASPLPAAPAPSAAPERRRPAIAFWLFWGHLATLFGIALSNGLLVLALLATPWRRLGERLARPAVQPLLGAVAIYALLLLLSIAASFDPLRSLGEGSELFNLAPVLLTLALVRGDRAARLALDALVVVALVQALVGIGQFLAQGEFDLSQRIQGSMSHYMTFSGVLLVADLVLLSQLAVDFHRPSWRWLALVPINVALVGSLTRSAWVGFIVGFLVVVALGRRRLLVLGIPLILVVFLWLPQGTLLSRVASIVDLSDTTNYDRLCMASAGLLMIEERPLLGQGPAMVRERYTIYRHPTAPRMEVPHLHNTFLQLAAERGLTSLLAYLALMGLAFRRAWHLYRAEGGRQGPRGGLLLGVMAALVGFNVSGLFESNWTDTELQRMMLVILTLPFALEPALAAGDEGDEEAATGKVAAAG